MNPNCRTEAQSEAKLLGEKFDVRSHNFCPVGERLRSGILAAVIVKPDNYVDYVVN
jgi:hypothetical protein